MTLPELLALMDMTPTIADIHPVSLCYLPSDITVCDTATEVTHLLDDPAIVLPGRFLIRTADRHYDSRFPHVTCDHDPITHELNDVLFTRYDEIAKHMLCQSQLANRIVSEAGSCQLVVLLLVDGLSYRDVKGWDLFNSNTYAQLEPCLVDVPSVTRVAFPNIVNSPTIAEQLFDMGYHDRLGFTYWTREDNMLTDRLFFAISETQKTNHFPNILAGLQDHFDKKHGSAKTFVQIIRTGLDGYAHSQKRHPPIKAILGAVEQELVRIADLCVELNQKYGWHINIHLTSDHGILWFHEFDPVVIGTAPARASARWCYWRELYYQEEKGRQYLVGNEEYYCLDFPKLRRPPRIDEQGVHGGISYQESVVPFITLRIR